MCQKEIWRNLHRKTANSST